MTQKQYPHYVGVRLSEADYQGLHKLINQAGESQSDILRFLVRTASQRAETVATLIRKEKVAGRGSQS